MNAKVIDLEEYKADRIVENEWRKWEAHRDLCDELRQMAGNQEGLEFLCTYYVSQGWCTTAAAIAVVEEAKQGGWYL